MDEPTTQTLSIDQLERQQGLLEEEEEEHGGPARARRRSRESRGSTAAGAGNNTVITSGEVIQVDMSRLANVLGCGLDELLQSLRREATSEAEGVAVDGKGLDLDLDESVLYPPPRIRQALVTTVSRAPVAVGDAVGVEGSEEEEVPRPLWVLGGAGGKTIIELVLLNLMKGGVDRVVIVVGSDGDKIKEAVERSQAAGKLKIEFLEDTSDPSKQFHAKSILRARGAFDSPFLFVTSDHLFHPSLLHLLAVQDLGKDGGCVLVEDTAGPDMLKDMPATAVFVRRSDGDSSSATCVDVKGGEAGDEGEANATGDGQVSRRVMTIGRREQGQGQRWDGIECGAIVLSTEIFDTLSALWKRRRRYFTLADALDIMAGECMLKSVSTEGKPWLAMETQAQLRHGNESLVQGLVNQTEPFPWELKVAPKAGTEPAVTIGAAAAAAAAATAALDASSVSMQRRLSLNMDPATADVEDQADDSSAPDFKGFIVPVEAAAPEGGKGSTADDEVFLTRGHSMRKRVSLEEVMMHMEEPDAEAGEGIVAGGSTVTLPWGGGASADVGFIVSVPAEDGGEELVFAVPELQQKQSTSAGGGGGFLGPCCGAGGAGGGSICGGGPGTGGVGGAMDGDSDGEGAMMGYDSDGEDYDYNCLGGGILAACLPEMPSEMPSDIQSVRVTTEVLADKEGEEPTLAVHVIVDRSVPVLGWVLMVSALFGCAAMAPMGDLLSSMSPDATPAVYPVWRYSCSSVMYFPWFFLMVAGSKTARAELRDPSVILPIFFAGVGLAGWGLCFYTALNFTSASMVALLASLTPMCLVVWRGITGDAVHMLEIVGVLLAMAGGVISTIGEGGGDDGADIDASDTAVKTAADGVPDVGGSGSSGEGQAIGIVLGLGAACCGGLYILNAKAARNKCEVSTFAFIASIVPAAMCAAVLLAGYGGSPEGRQLLLGPSGLLGWTNTPGLALAQIVTSVLGDMIGNFGFYLLLKYISPLVVSLASLTVPLLAVVEGLMLGVVSPPGILFGVGACLILIGAGTASMVSVLPRTEVFDATQAVKTTAEATAGLEKSPAPNSSLHAVSPRLGGYGAVDHGAHKRRRSSLDGSSNATTVATTATGGRTHFRPHSLTDSKNLQRLEGLDEGGVGGGGGGGGGARGGESLPLLSLNADEKGTGNGNGGGGGSWLPRMFK